MAPKGMTVYRCHWMNRRDLDMCLRVMEDAGWYWRTVNMRAGLAGKIERIKKSLPQTELDG